MSQFLFQKIQHINVWERHMIRVNSLRTKVKSRRWIWWKPEYVEKRFLWEQVYGFYNGQKLSEIVTIYENNIDVLRSVLKYRGLTRSLKKTVNDLIKLRDEGLQSAYTDPRLTPMDLQTTRPSWFKVPTHVHALLNRAGIVMLSKKTVMVAVLAATMAATPELGPYFDNIYPTLRDEVLVTGSTIAPALVFIWTYWRKYVTASQKKRLKSLKDKKIKLELLRSQVNSRTVDATLDKNIMQLEKEITREWNIAFKHAYISAVPAPRINNFKK